MRSVLEKTLDLAFGAAAMTRDKAQELVDDLVKRGEAAREDSGTLVDDLMSRGQKQREEMQAFVQREVTDALSRINVATREDIARLERRVQELEVMVEDLGGKRPAAAVVPEVLPPEAEAPTVTELPSP